MNHSRLSAQAQVTEEAKRKEKFVETCLFSVLNDVRNNGGRYRWEQGEGSFCRVILWDLEFHDMIRSLGFEIEVELDKVTKVKGLIFDHEVKHKAKITITNPLLFNKEREAAKLDEAAKERIKLTMKKQFG